MTVAGPRAWTSDNVYTPLPDVLIYSRVPASMEECDSYGLSVFDATKESPSEGGSQLRAFTGKTCDEAHCGQRSDFLSVEVALSSAGTDAGPL